MSALSFNNRSGTCIHCLKVRFTPNALEPLRNCVSTRRVFVCGRLRWMRLQREVWSQGVRDCLHCIAGWMARLPASHGDDNAHHTMVDEYEVKLQWLNVTAGVPCCSAKTRQHMSCGSCRLLLSSHTSHAVKPLIHRTERNHLFVCIHTERSNHSTPLSTDYFSTQIWSGN